MPALPDRILIRLADGLRHPLDPEEVYFLEAIEGATRLRSRSARALIADGSLASLYFGYEQNTVGARLVFARPSRQEDGTYQVPLSVEVPIDSLALVPRQENHVGRFRFAFAVMDASGNVSPVQQPEPVTLEIPGDEIEQARGSHFTYETQLLMKRGSSRVAVAIHDEVADQSSFVSETITIGSG